MASMSPLVKLRTLHRTIANWWLVPLDKAGLVREPVYRARGGLEFRCRSRSTDINEITACASGAEYPAELVRLPPGATVVDLGANIGGFTAYCAQVNRGVEFSGHAVEPSSANAALLRDNLARNGISQVAVHQIAIDGADGQVTLDISGENDSFRLDAAASTRGEVVEARTLSSFCRDHGIADIDLLKMDVEGSEYAIIGADRYFIVGHVKALILEYHLGDRPDGLAWILGQLGTWFDHEVVCQNEGNGVLSLVRNAIAEDDGSASVDVPASAAPLVSIVIPTRNAARHLPACLASIARQDYPSIEVVVVDQSSDDGTSDVAAAYGARVLSRPAPTYYSPPSASRNIGAAASAGEIIYHLDSDMELADGLIAEAVAALQDDPATAALAVHEVDRATNFWARCKAVERRCYWGHPALQAARIVRRGVFEDVGGYDETVESGEDFYIHSQYRQRGPVGFVQRTVTHNLESLDFGRLVRKKFDYGKTGGAYFRLSGDRGTSLVGRQLRCYLANWPLLVRRPHLTAGMAVLRTSELVAGVAGMRAARARAVPQPK
jgi:FkbM family methyltransferase